jgi:hypothetical protein
VRNLDATQDEFPPDHQLVNIVTNANMNHADNVVSHRLPCDEFLSAPFADSTNRCYVARLL